MALTPEQIELRKTGLGGSDIGAALGFCQYRSPLDVYLEKTEGKTQEESYRMWWGTGLEPFILDTLERRAHFFSPETQAPSTLTRAESIGTIRHPEHSWALATPDAFAIFLHEGREVTRLMEVKTAAVKRAEGWGDAGSSDVPTKYAAQALWTMWVARSVGIAVDEAWVLALFGNREPQWFAIPYDAGRIAWLVEQGRKFWNENVLAHVPPTQTQEAA